MTKKGTCEQLYKTGFLEIGATYIENTYTHHCKKILGLRIKCKKKHPTKIMLESISRDNGCWFFRFTFPEYPNRSESCGKLVVKKLKGETNDK